MKRRNLPVVYIVAFLFISSWSLAGAQSLPSQPPSCPAAQLSFALDNENGYFDGMSHSGTLLILRNLGPDACSVSARPILGFEDAAHHPLPVSLETLPGMHPDPVIVPVVIPAGAEVTSQIRWVSSDAFGANNSIAPTFITLSVGRDTLRLRFTARMFGPAGKHPSYSVATLFKRDPVYTPSKP